MPYFKYNNSKIFYDEIGNGEPIVFLHGNTASSKMFSNIAEAFANKYKVILIDFLGHGLSDRVQAFATDLWFDEALQVIAFLEQMSYDKVNLIGSSGGALVAINVALERPDLVDKVIADSFEGEAPLLEFVQNIKAEREASKQDEAAISFYFEMHGNDWERVVDNDTNAMFKHSQSIGKFYHKPLSKLQPEILLTGSKEDEFAQLINPNFYEQTYSNMIEKIGHGTMHIFNHGGHPAIMSNAVEFAEIAKVFFNEVGI